MSEITEKIKQELLIRFKKSKEKENNTMFMEQKLQNNY